MIEAPNFRDRELLQRLIRYAFHWKDVPADRTEAACLHLDDIVETIKRRGTQLEGLAANDLRGLRPEVVRKELLEMPDIRARDPNTPKERFCLLRLPVEGHAKRR